MEVKIGIQNVAREVVIDTNIAADLVLDSLKEALANESVWQLTDEKGRRVLVPVASIAYVDLGAEASRPVGFGAL